jgi:hypothetical protein
MFVRGETMFLSGVLGLASDVLLRGLGRLLDRESATVAASTTHIDQLGRGVREFLPQRRGILPDQLPRASVITTIHLHAQLITRVPGLWVASEITEQRHFSAEQRRHF